MKTDFGALPDGRRATLFFISDGKITAAVTDFGATLVRLTVPDAAGVCADVVLGCDCAADYARGSVYFGATVGRNANRIAGGRFRLGGTEVILPQNENGNSLHSGPEGYHLRLWQAESCADDRVTFRLDSPDGDQGFPGSAVIRVTYSVGGGALCVRYDAVSDRDTVFNLTNHSYFNLAGHDRPERAMAQTLCLAAEDFTPADAQNIPTGEIRSAAGTPLDFSVPKPLERDLGADALAPQHGYDHNFVLSGAPAAVLRDPGSGRTLTLSTDCPGLQVYSGNFLANEPGKGGVSYPRRGGVALEPQFFPDAVHHPDWPQPVTKAGEAYRSVTRYAFT